jgi:hypothetical protein
VIVPAGQLPPKVLDAYQAQTHFSDEHLHGSS